MRNPPRLEPSFRSTGFQPVDSTRAGSPCYIKSLALPPAPYYQPAGDECAVFEAAWRNRLPVLIKGPTGCGKTRFVAHMAARLSLPLYTVACHDDLSAADLVGRHLLHGGETIWCDGPLTRAVREGGICYLDEVVEARKDTTVVLHPLADDRRILPIERTGEVLAAPPGFMLVVSYNPGYQNLLKSLKPSTRQRFIALRFDFPNPEQEAGHCDRRNRLRCRHRPATGPNRPRLPRPQGT
jgi:nitric oxide reductase NorQ protein